MATRYVAAFFTDGGTPQTGLSPTIRIRDLADDALDVTDASMSEVGDGWYKYAFTGYVEGSDYVIRMDGTSSLPDHERYKYAGNEALTEEEINAQVDTAITDASLPTATQVRDAVWANQIDGVAADLLLQAHTAVLLGQATVSGNTVTYKDRDGSTTRVTVTVDTDSNRTVSTITGE